VAQNFAWQTQATGNNTATPSATLALLFGAGTASPTATGLSIAPNGNINFSPSQIFPIKGTGGGTITGITTSSPLTGSGTTGSVAVGLNTAALETTLNGVYAQLNAADTFAGAATFSNGLTANASTGSAAVTGNGTQGVAGIDGTTDNGSAVYGNASGTGYAGYFVNSTTTSSAVYAENDATGDPGLGIALKGVVPNPYSIAVLGKALGASSYGVFGENVGGADGYGVYASASGPGSTAVYGKSTGGVDGNGVLGSGVVGISSSGNGVEGSSQGSSNSGAGLSTAGVWGVWGDIGSSGSAGLGAGVLGTADTFTAGWFENNGPNATLIANNSGAGQAASFNGYTTYQESATLSAVNSSTGSAGEMDNYSNTAVTLYLSNSGTGGVTDAVAKTTGPATGALFKTLMASTPTGTCGIGGNGDLSCTGQVKSLVSTGGGARKVETYAPQSAENWMEDYGTGRMEQGVAVVRIDPAFAETASETPDYHVFITPNADAEALYVINKTPTSFEVRESKGGTSSLTFDYKIVARRRGYEAQRLVDVTERFNAASAAVMPRKDLGARNLRPHAPALNNPNSPVARRTPADIDPAATKHEIRQGTKTQH